jgi:DNA-binding IclR family transcriptional regulator
VKLSDETNDTVHLGILDGDYVLYLDKINGNRRISVSSIIGERQPLRSTGLGKALLLDSTPEMLRDIYDRESIVYPNYSVDRLTWLERMQNYSRTGYALDLEENDDRVRCVAAPIRDASNKIVGSISVSSAAQYMDDDRMIELTARVLETVKLISEEIGWNAKKFLKI